MHGQPDFRQRQQYFSSPQRFNYTGGNYQRQDTQRYQSNGGSLGQRENNYQRQDTQRFQYNGGGFGGQRQNNYQRQDTQRFQNNNTWSNQRRDTNQRFNYSGGDGWRGQPNRTFNGNPMAQRIENNNRWDGNHQRGGNGDWRDGHHNLNGWRGNEWWRNSGGHVQIYFGNSYYGPWRYGYYQYNPYWNDASFFFGFYTYSPYDPCVVSPWYVYPTLPPYIAYNRVYVVNGTSCNWYGGRQYYYTPTEGVEGYGNPDLNYAIDQIVQAFNTGENTELERLVPPDSRISIYNEGQYMYSVNGGDFYNMLQDNIHGTRTQRYSITSVRMEGDDAIVTARHDYYNPYNGVSSAYQMFRLRPSGDGYIITDFMTSATPVGGSSYFGG